MTANGSMPTKFFTECFVAGTPIHTKNGLTPIEQVIEGDLVAARNEHTGETTWRPVKQLFTIADKIIVDVTLRNQNELTEVISSTNEHPFFINGEGWRAAKDLKENDKVDMLDGNVAEIVSIEFASARATAYNFEVSGVHTYFVGEIGVWVHNSSSMNWADVKAGKVPNGRYNKVELSVPRTGRRPGHHDARVVHQQNGLIDLDRLDDLGRTSRDRMRQGLAPIGPDGAPIQLHHTTQVEKIRSTGKRGSLAEVSEFAHQQNTSALHMPGQKSFRNDRLKDQAEYRLQKRTEGKTPVEDKDKYHFTDSKGKIRSELDKKIRTQDDKDFGAFKKDYWKQRIINLENKT